MGVFIWEKKSRQQPGQPSASVSWDEFNFRLHEKFSPGLQGWICNVVLFWVQFSLILVTVQPSLLSVQLSFLAYQIQNLIPQKPFVICKLRCNYHKRAQSKAHFFPFIFATKSSFHFWAHIIFIAACNIFVFMNYFY